MGIGFSRSGGGGAADRYLGIVSSPPASPTEGDYWMLEVVAASEPTTCTASIEPLGPQVIALSVATPTLSKIARLGRGAVGALNIEWQDTGGSLSIDTVGATWSIFYNSATHTVQQVVDALNVVSQARISQNIAAVGSGAVGGDNFGTAVGGDDSVSFTQNGTFGEYAMQMQWNGYARVIITGGTTNSLLP